MIIFTQNSQQMEHKLMRYNLELEHIASTDPLTGLFNRWQMCKYLENPFLNIPSTKYSLLRLPWVILTFQTCNDTYGHDAGDEVLRTLSRLFRTIMDEKGTSAAGAEKNSCFYFPTWIWTRFSF